jgi:large subunit ribosomal protein L24
MRKIKSKDEVIVITGKDKGKRGEVMRVLDDGRVVVSGVHRMTHYERPDPNTGRQGGLVEREGPIDVSNVAIFNRDTGKADRVGFSTVEEGGATKKIRIFKSTKKPIDG